MTPVTSLSTLVAAGVAVVLLGAAAAQARARHRTRARLAGREALPLRRGAGPASLGVVAVAALGAVTAWSTVGPAAAAVLGLVAVGSRVRVRLRQRSADRRRRHAQLPAALERLAAALRSGSSLTTALDEVGSSLEAPLGPELAALGAECARGRPVHDVIGDWSRAHDDAGTRLAAAALALSTLVGSAPARAVDGVAATVRERLDLAAERRAMAAQARASALVLSVAPVAFAALLVVGDTAAAGFLLGTPAGWTCLVVGIGLDAAGAWWMSRLSQSDVP